MPFLHTPELIQMYATGKLKHGAYDKTAEMYCALKQHANGEVPVKVICNRRPSESDRIKDYRVEIYEPMTRAPISKVISSVSKIRRSPDWDVRFETTDIKAIADSESLERYLMETYPNDFGSITNWIFTVGLKEYLLDSNGVILVTPLVWDIETTDYFQPYPTVFNAPQVLDFYAASYAVLLSDAQCSYDIRDQNGSIIATKYDGAVILVVDETGVYTYNQISQDKRFTLVDTRLHTLGVLPAFKIPGIFFEVCNGVIVKESRINGMVPDLNEAARMYSDLQAEFVQHVHSDRWEIMNTRCTHCNGSGQLLLDEGDLCSCHHCKGSGYVPTSPYTVRVLTPPQIGEEPLPTPPAGYIQKTDVAEMCDRLDNAVKTHLYNSLAAVNMQNLDQVPLAISGTAKEVDRDEQSNFVHAVAEDIVYIMDKIAFITNEYRNRIAVPDIEKRKQLLPKISVPDRFDLFSVDTLANEVASAKEKNLNSYIVATMESEYASKKFYNQPEIAKLVQLSYILDPLAGLSEEDKIIRVQNDGVSKIDYIISSNIVPFIKRALRENKKFESLAEDAQLSTLMKYAQEKQENISAAGRLRQALTEQPAIDEVVEPEEIIEE